MSYTDRIDPEILHALDTYPAERYIAVGDDPPLARQMTEAINREMRASCRRRTWRFLN